MTDKVILGISQSKTFYIITNKEKKSEHHAHSFLLSNIQFRFFHSVSKHRAENTRADNLADAYRYGKPEEGILNAVSKHQNWRYDQHICEDRRYRRHP